MTSTAPSAPLAGRSTLRAILGWLALALVLAFAGRALWRDLVQLDWRALHVQWAPLVGCAALLAGVSALRVASFKLLLDAYAASITWRQSIVVAWVPSMAKFVPGQFLSVVGAVGMLRQVAVPGALALAVVLSMDGIAVLTGVITAAPLLLSDSAGALWPHGCIIGALALVAGLVSLHPAVLARLLNALLKRLDREPMRAAASVHAYLWPVALGFVHWVLVGTALWLMAHSVLTVSAARVPACIAIAALAYTAGYLTPFAPAGLGVREAILQAALLPWLGAPTAVVVIALRVLQTLGEIAMGLVAVAVLRRLPLRAQAG